MDSAADEASEDLAYRIIASILHDEGWQLTVKSAEPGFVADVTNRADTDLTLAGFATGDTRASAALAAYRRYIERFADCAVTTVQAPA